MKSGSVLAILVLVSAARCCEAQQVLPEFIGVADALDRQTRRGVIPEHNAVARLCEVVELYPDGYSVRLRHRLEFHRRLGVAAAGPETPSLRELTRFQNEFREVEHLLRLADVRFHLPGFHEDSSPESTVLLAEKARRDVDRLPWIAEQYPTVALWLRSQEPVLRVIRESVTRSYWYMPVFQSRGSDGAQLPVALQHQSAGELLTVMSLLRTSAMFRLGEGQVRAAGTELLTLLRLSRHLQSALNPHYFTGMAMESVGSELCRAWLSSTAVTEADIDEFMAGLQALLVASDPLLYCEQYDRVVTLELLEFLRRDTEFSLIFLPDPLAHQSAVRMVQQVLRQQSADWEAVAQRLNREYDRLQQVYASADITQAMLQMDQVTEQWEGAWQQSKSALETGKSVSQDTVTEYISLRLLLGLPALHGKRGFALGTRIDHSLLQASCWLRKYQIRMGDWPETLGEVEQLFGCRLPLDPVSGQSLKYRGTGAAIRFYSVGCNGIDDGGVRNRMGETASSADDTGIHCLSALPALRGCLVSEWCSRCWLPRGLIGLT